MRTMKRVIAALLAIGLLAVASMVGLSLWIQAVYADRIYSTVADVPKDDRPRIAIVFGAGLQRDSQPTPIRYDRVAAAAELYRAGRVDKLLLTGDNRFVNYNEPEAMRRTALQMGVPDADVVLDYAGRRTYDSCYRAKEIFGVNRAILVTQAFHLDRALYLCDAFGIDSIGLAADLRSYARGAETWWSIREMGAMVGAWIDVNVTRPIPVLGEKIPIGE